VVASVLEYCCQHAAMFVRTVDAERALLQVEATGSYRVVVVVEALLLFSLLEQSLMRDRGAPADIADMDRPRLIERSSREPRHINRKRQVGARSTGNACHVLDTVTVPKKDVIKIG